MVTGTSHSNIHPEVEKTFSCRSSNRITKEYYWFLVGEINRGTIKRLFVVLKTTHLAQNLII